MPIEKRSFITRQMLRDEPNTTFVFGDNLLGLGYGGQAKEMRGEPNAFGIPTKHKPSNKPDAFFTDDDLHTVAPIFQRRFMVLLKRLEERMNIVWSEAGIGTGLADLEHRAPK